MLFHAEAEAANECRLGACSNSWMPTRNLGKEVSWGWLCIIRECLGKKGMGFDGVDGGLRCLCQLVH